MSLLVALIISDATDTPRRAAAATYLSKTAVGIFKLKFFDSARRFGVGFFFIVFVVTAWTVPEL